MVLEGFLLLLLLLLPPRRSTLLLLPLLLLLLLFLALLLLVLLAFPPEQSQTKCITLGVSSALMIILGYPGELTLRLVLLFCIDDGHCAF